ncbi:Tat-linked quality control protein TatD [Trichinella spiralis]|uniref:Deoxyribonuclease TATDN1 n=1 Tax=Trichinella spiralis TaxID=6334 RepID=A0A0V1C2J3_TRISP|nr:Tat-linked quality control protein TatD [Trichinella spiralis]
MITDVAPYKLIDIGANLTNPCLNDRNLCDVVDRAKAAGVCKIIVTGTSIETAKEAMRLSRLYPNYLFFTAGKWTANLFLFIKKLSVQFTSKLPCFGIHPHDAKYFNDESIAELEKLALEPECVAIGECGLDFNRNFSPQENQLTAFEAQVWSSVRARSVLKIRVPALVEILKKYSLLIPYAVVHCFTGTAEQAKTYLDMGLYIGLTGSLWKDKLEFGVQYALRQGIIPLNRLLVETDSPYMYPNIKAKKLQREVKEKVSPHALQFLHHCSFQRNEPCALPTVVELIAAFSGASVDDVAINTTLNAVRLFGLTSE